MIFGYGDDGVLEVFESVADVRRDCEGIDVESGTWDFFDAAGLPLKPVFRVPNKVEKHFFGMFTSVVSSQEFDLVPVTDGSEPALVRSITPDTPLGRRGALFESAADVIAYLSTKDTSEIGKTK
ncbi:MAG: hypothetical protein Q8K65_00325 [Alphaproteobacteria bacterium]|nr:hypothetical protein [Alphaproteobacteria bacterium]